MELLITPDQLRFLRERAAVVVFHASMGPHPPTQVIRGAYVADLEGDFSDASDPLPHTVPHQIQEVFASYGVSEDTPVVIYDSDGATAARIWWLARVAGVRDVALLDGGLNAWVSAGGDLCAPQDKPATPGSFLSSPTWSLLVDADEVERTDRTVVDARSHDRFTGAVEEPRPGLRCGHIPGSRNVPYTEVYNPDGTFKTPEELAKLFPDDHLVFSCGSGVTACVDAFAATLAGRKDLVVYEGSWSQWGRPDSGREIATKSDEVGRH
ncbi:sulfurtransferase [Corynebacterium cystitidis]|uniref:sulfurtransferase n=1 Tax=Corynebacterium cystitidis TaxID=35757 RepID=UPI00211EC5B6|nr:sulfurtransferase [Corynebacterium cystitidis]